jgi:hypothetical protein
VLTLEVASIVRFTYLPEVLDHRVALSVAAVVSVLLPVVDIDVCYATDEELEFTFVKDVDKIRGDELVEALHKGIELFINTLLNAPLCYEPDNWSVLSTRSDCGAAKLTRRIPSCSRSSLQCPFRPPSGQQSPSLRIAHRQPRRSSR